MPRVPLSQGQQVERQARPNATLEARATPEDYGAAVGQGLQNLGQGVNQIAEVYRQRADQVAVLEADRKLSDLENELMYAPETGALNRRGKDAFELPEQVMTEYERRAAEIEGELGGERQRQAFQRRRMARRNDINRSLQRHVAGEMQRYEAAETEAYVANARSAAVANFDDPERVGLEIARQRAAFVDHAERNGMPAEWTRQKIIESESATHADVVERMLGQGDDLRAAAYFEANKDGLAGADLQRVEKAVTEGSRLGESRRQADAILTEHSEDIAGALEAAGQISDTQVADATRTRIRQFFADQRAAEKQVHEQALETAQQAVEGGENPLDLSPSVRNNLTSAELSALETRYRQVNEGIEPTNDARKWLAFRELSSRDLQNMSSAELYAQYRPKLDNSHWDRAVELWSASQPGNGDSAKLSSTITFKDRVDNTLRTSGIIPADKTPSQMNRNQAEIYARFEQEAASAVEQFEIGQLNGNRKATGDEIQQIIDEMVMRKVFVDRSFRTDPELPTAVLTDEQRGNAYVPIDAVPQAERNRIENLIRSQGRPVRRDTVQRAYAQYLIGNRAAFNAIIEE